MMKKLSFAMPLFLAVLMTACSSTEANKTTPEAPAAPAASNPPEVKAEGTLTTIPATAEQPAQPTQPAIAATPAPAAPVNPNAPAPKLFIANKKVDFGSVKQDITINRSISLKNTGKGELRIESVTPSCGCTAVDFDKIIAPGKAGAIKFKVDTGKGVGPRTKTITIKSNDPEQPTITYEFSFTLK